MAAAAAVSQSVTGVQYRLVEARLTLRAFAVLDARPVSLGSSIGWVVCLNEPLA